jgi:broad specificity phosphatase PhoE
MKFYFIRHGQSEGNVEGLVQSSTEHLTEKGKQQAQMLGKRLENTPIDLIVASPYTRTKETANIVNDSLQVPLEYSDLFVELMYPSELHGKPYSGEALPVLDLLRENYHDPSFRYSDEETFLDFKSRGQKAIEFLKSKEEQNILIITHGTFIKLILGLALLGGGMNSHQLQRFRSTLLSRNTGITYFEYRDYESERQNEGFRVWAHNDHAHLGEI